MDSIESAINGNLIVAKHITKSYSATDCNDVPTALMRKRAVIFDEIETHRARLGGVKWYVAVKVIFNKFVNNIEVTATPTFHGKTRALLPTDSVVEQFMEARDKIMESMAKWVSEGSGWSLQRVERIDLCIVKYQPLHAASYIPTPKAIAHPSKGIVNIKNADQKCFLWSILAALHGPNQQRNYRVSQYRPYEHELNMVGIEYPVKISDIRKFEKQNHNISINIFGFDSSVYPLHITNEQGRQHHINLLLLTSDEGNTHYCLITNLSRLLANLTKRTHATFYCNYCLHRFRDEVTLRNHTPYCKPHGAQKTRLPTGDDKWLSFKNYSLCHKVPFTIYADFESFVVPLQTCHNNPTTSHTTDTAVHIPSGYCYVIVDSQGNVLKPPRIYTGPDVVDNFLENLLAEAQSLQPRIHQNISVVMSDGDKRDFENATHCHLCHKPLGDDKVLNHNHLTGQYLGAAHNSCNLSYKVPQHIPVFFHNLRGYDCHHLMQGFGKFKKEKMSVIAKTSERYISVTLESLRFLDSLQFLNCSLETLVKNLASDGPAKFNHLRQCMGDDHLDLLLRKGVFPYTWFDGPDKLDIICLPPREAFFNDLTKMDITVDDYSHAEAVWNAFNMSTMRDYHNLYLQTDVLLLADVFENFRNTSLHYYNIDPCNVVSSPGLAWNAMLKMTGVRLELLTDIDQHLFIEAGVRGGVAMIPHRFARANNPYLSDYDSSLPTSYLLYLDCNNLYGTAMSQPLPQSNFNWLSRDIINRINFETVPDDAEFGYILEVDLHYPDYLHDHHKDLPLAPERKSISFDMLSPYNKIMCDKLKIRPSKVSKLLTTLEDKEKYIVHYRNLKLYLRLGLQLRKIHRVIQFRQSPWLAPFINFNTDKRRAANNAFEKDFFKLMNNATYGKSLENVRSRIDFKLVTTERELIKWTASPRLTNFFPFNKDLAGLTLKKSTIQLNRPVYAGFAILDISKLIMYEFHYDWAKRKYGETIKLCMTDTDSLFYHIKTADVYHDIKQELHLFDTSDYPTTHPCYSAENKKKLGKFKDEFNSKPPKEIVGLRAKCYSVLDADSVEKRVAKGVPRTAIRTQLKHDQYIKCLFEHIQKTTFALTIQSNRHNIFTKQINKLSLSPYDDKRYVMGDGIHTLPYGHYSIRRKRSSSDCEGQPQPKLRKTNEPTDLEILASML